MQKLRINTSWRYEVTIIDPIASSAQTSPNIANEEQITFPELVCLDAYTLADSVPKSAFRI